MKKETVNNEKRRRMNFKSFNVNSDGRRKEERK